MEDIDPSQPQYIIDYRRYWKLFIAEKVIMENLLKNQAIKDSFKS